MKKIIYTNETTYQANVNKQASLNYVKSQVSAPIPKTVIKDDATQEETQHILLTKWNGNFIRGQSTIELHTTLNFFLENQKDISLHYGALNMDTLGSFKIIISEG